MPTDTFRGNRHALGFALRVAAWYLGLFVFLRLNWVEVYGLLPLTQLQARLAVGLCGTPSIPVQATLECSGADALALCLGFILAYPARWRLRLAGAGIGLVLILGLNTLRIGTLGLAAASPAWFEALHVYLWPGALTLAIAGYVFVWMRLVDRWRVGEAAAAPPASPGVSPGESWLTPRNRRFVGFTVAFLVLFTAASPFLFESARILAAAAFVARAAAAVLRGFGIEASAAANLLSTPRGRFMVTQECISTPLIAVYLAAILAYSRTWLQRAVGLLATVPLFVGLGIARLLVVALPAALVASPLLLVHAFYQILLAAVIVIVAACWRHGAGGEAMRPALRAILLGSALVVLLGTPGAWAVGRTVEILRGTVSSGVAGAASLDDPQGAVRALPAFQAGLYVAVWLAAFTALGWRRFVAGLALLGLTLVATLLLLHVLAVHAGFTTSVSGIRAWALVGPLLVIAAVAHADRRLRRRAPGMSSVGDDARD